MTVDTWTEVWRIMLATPKAIASRLMGYWPPERRRREAQREYVRKLAQSVIDAASSDDDAGEVSAWMAEQGFMNNTWTEGIDERTEIALEEATTEFRRKVEAIMGDECYIHVQIAAAEEDVDSEDTSP